MRALWSTRGRVDSSQSEGSQFDPHVTKAFKNVGEDFSNLENIWEMKSKVGGHWPLFSLLKLTITQPRQIYYWSQVFLEKRGCTDSIA